MGVSRDVIVADIDLAVAAFDVETANQPLEAITRDTRRKSAPPA